MTNDDTNPLSDELHELADSIGPTAPAAARDRARRGIARHARNRRAAMGAAGVVVVIVGTVFVTVDRTHDDTARPIGTTSQPSVTTSSSTAVAPTTTTVRVPNTIAAGADGSYVIPVIDAVPSATSAYTRNLPWGRAAGHVAFSVPQGEGASGGPTGFSADAAGNIALLDHSNARIMLLNAHVPATSKSIDLASPAVTASVFDAQGRVIVALYNDLAVYGPDGARQATFAGAGASGAEYTHLIVVGDTVYAVAENNALLALLQDKGSGYVQTRPTTFEPDALHIRVDSGRHLVDITVAGTQKNNRVRTDDTLSIRDVPAARVLPDGSLVFVMGFDEGSTDPDHVATYVVGRVYADGGMELHKLQASAGYLVNGPAFVVNDDGLAVMGSNTTNGVDVSYYPFD